MNINTGLKFAIMAAIVLHTQAQSPQVPVAVSCEADMYALCAYSKCTLNDDMKTANCSCYAVAGSSLARIDVIPDPLVHEATVNTCIDLVSCANGNAPICNAINDETLWPGADIISTFSRELEVENGVKLDEDGERTNPSWHCTAPHGGRLVPNCMLAPCRTLDTPVTNPYFHGEATVQCTCPLVRASLEYPIFGGLEDPCDEGLVNTGGPVLAKHAMDRDAVELAWEAVAEEFARGFNENHNSNDFGAVTLEGLTSNDNGDVATLSSSGDSQNHSMTAAVTLIVPILLSWFVAR